jgi:3-dehydroquinate synthase
MGGVAKGRTISVNVSGYTYDVCVRPGLLAEAGQFLKQLCPTRKVGVVTDTTVHALHYPALVDGLERAGFSVVTAVVPAGEEHKTLAEVSRIFDQLLPHGLERSTPLIALGGGVVGDMAGFVAATLLRGVPFMQVPTTLLAMVDASVGGKTGVDHPAGKNLIGAFHQPIAVLCDVSTLRTLPARQLRSGLAECIKHQIIRDADGFAMLESRIADTLQLNTNDLVELVAHNVAIKARVVEADPLEQGERAHLNFGHTFGHAIEQASQYRYAHGEAVALGMVAAARAAVRMGILAPADCARIEKLIAAGGLPTGGLTLDVDEIMRVMLTDKKVRDGRIRFVLPDQIGHVLIRDDVAPAIVREALVSLRD